MFASQETGTWTITVTMPNGMMCLVASGEAYETLAEELEPAADTALGVLIAGFSVPLVLGIVIGVAVLALVGCSRDPGPIERLSIKITFIDIDRIAAFTKLYAQDSFFRHRFLTWKERLYSLKERLFDSIFITRFLTFSKSKVISYKAQQATNLPPSGESLYGGKSGLLSFVTNRLSIC